jgi:O-methyltransferase
VDGAIVECGCYTGGSTAKLSIIAKIMNKNLLVFDSFEGLPEADQYNKRDCHTRRSSKWFTGWNEGRYAASLEQVKSNIQAYGEMSVCSFYKGWFSDMLTKDTLPQSICFAFTDVDVARSARECFVAIWPRIPDGGIYFSHDIAYIRVLQALLDETLGWGEQRYRKFHSLSANIFYNELRRRWSSQISMEMKHSPQLPIV